MFDHAGARSTTDADGPPEGCKKPNRPREHQAENRRQARVRSGLLQNPSSLRLGSVGWFDVWTGRAKRNSGHLDAVRFQRADFTTYETVAELRILIDKVSDLHVVASAALYSMIRERRLSQ